MNRVINTWLEGTTLSTAPSSASAALPNVMGELVGSSPEMKEIFRLAARVAPTDTNVLLTGEKGCGKKLLAQFIHQRSNRADAPFVVINCGDIPMALLEGELFGYENSSDGYRIHAGAFEQAKGGTLVLDEITAISPEIQTRLLNVLQTRKLSRVDAASEIPIDIRLIATTSRTARKTRDDQMQDDILYRLSIFPIEIPSLRNRSDDKVLLAEHFLAALNAREGAAKQFSSRSREILLQHTWPGNVRDLKNCVERAYILGDIMLELEPMNDDNTAADAASKSTDYDLLNIRVGARIDEVERSLIEATLNYFQGNKRRAAGVLGCSVKTLYNKLNEYSRNEKSGKMYGANQLGSDSQLPA